MRSEKEIREIIEYVSKKREEAYHSLNVRTTVYLEGFRDCLYWILKEKELEI